MKTRSWRYAAALTVLAAAPACDSGGPTEVFSCPGLAYGGALVRLESAATSEPVSGARVALFDGANSVGVLEEVAAEQGLYNFADAPAGFFSLLVEADGFATQWTRIEVAQVADPRCGPTLLGNVTIRLAGPLAASGVVIDLETGERRSVIVRSQAFSR